jgi:hypothetical protein
VPKELKPGWTYFTDDNLIGLEYAVHNETGWVYFSDMVKYSPEEIKILKESGITPTKQLHRVKKIFDGEIVRYEPRSGTTDKGKHIESGGGKNNSVNSDSGPKVPETTGSRETVRDGELEIY